MLQNRYGCASRLHNPHLTLRRNSIEDLEETSRTMTIFSDPACSRRQSCRAEVEETDDNADFSSLYIKQAIAINVEFQKKLLAQGRAMGRQCDVFTVCVNKSLKNNVYDTLSLSLALRYWQQEMP